MALKYFQKMKEENIKRNTRTYTSMIKRKEEKKAGAWITGSLMAKKITTVEVGIISKASRT